MRWPFIALAMLATHVLCTALLIDQAHAIVCVAVVGVAVAEMRGKN
jgi:hypothetical protein